jgi:RimK-like ATPgrasp N-terminal domain
MLVVSSIDLPTNLHAIEPAKFLSSTARGFTLNLNNDYRYMKTGYYVSLHAEILGNQVIPSSENIIDSSRNPILLLRANRVGIPTMPCIVTDSVKKIAAELGFPVIVYAVNPFIHEGYRVANNQTALYRAVKSLGMNYKFAVCAQPLRGEMYTYKAFFGNCEDPEANTIAENVYKLFQIPICQLHIQKIDRKAYLSGLQAIEENMLETSDVKRIAKEVLLLSMQGDHISG